MRTENRLVSLCLFGYTNLQIFMVFFRKSRILCIRTFNIRTLFMSPNYFRAIFLPVVVAGVGHPRLIEVRRGSDAHPDDVIVLVASGNRTDLVRKRGNRKSVQRPGSPIEVGSVAEASIAQCCQRPRIKS